jgi:hypothetical protein
MNEPKYKIKTSGQCCGSGSDSFHPLDQA